MSIIVFKKVVDKLRIAYGPDFASKMKDTDDATKNILTNYKDGATSLDLNTIVTMSEILSSKNLEKIFWVGVEKMENEVTEWKKSKENVTPPSLKEKYMSLADNTLKSIFGHGMRKGNINEGMFTAELSKI